MKKYKNKKHTFDLEKRTYYFAVIVRDFIKDLNYSITNREYSKQLARSSSSVGANYIEANEAFSKKDFLHRMKICRKEIKETRYWILLINSKKSDKSEILKDKLIQESTELLYIFNAIIKKCS